MRFHRAVSDAPGSARAASRLLRDVDRLLQLEQRRLQALLSRGALRGFPCPCPLLGPPRGDGLLQEQLALILVERAHLPQRLDAHRAIDDCPLRRGALQRDVDDSGTCLKRSNAAKLTAGEPTQLAVGVQHLSRLGVGDRDVHFQGALQLVVEDGDWGSLTTIGITALRCGATERPTMLVDQIGLTGSGATSSVTSSDGFGRPGSAGRRSSPSVIYRRL